MMDVRLRHLRWLVAVARHGSFRRAAEALHVRQSTLSRTIQLLECHLGVALFLRSNAGVELTQAGSRFLDTSTRLLADFDALLLTTGAFGRGKAGRLALGLATSFAMETLRSVVLDYSHECPNVDIQLTAIGKPALLADLNAGAIDLAIVAGGVNEQNFETVSLWSERILVAVHQSRPLAARPFLYWTDLSDEVVFTSLRGLGPELKEIMVAKLAPSGRLPRIENHAIGTEALLSLVAAGRGIALQCEGIVRASQPGLVHLEVHDTNGPSWIGYSACWKKQHGNPALAPFLAVLRAHRSMFSPIRVPDP